MQIPVFRSDPQHSYAKWRPGITPDVIPLQTEIGLKNPPDERLEHNQSGSRDDSQSDSSNVIHSGTKPVDNRLIANEMDRLAMSFEGSRTDSQHSTANVNSSQW